MKKLFPFLMPLFCLGQTSNFNFTNKPISDPEVNSYGRGAQYWNGTSWDNSQAPQIPNGTSTTGAKTLYWRYWWADNEAGQGVYKFTKASMGNDFWKSPEWHLEWCANNGALYAMGGMMTAWDDGIISYDGGVSVYPQYLHNMMQAEPVYKDWKWNGVWIPNWNSQAYLDRFKALNDTLLKFIRNWKFTPTSGPWAGKLVEGYKIIDFIDLRGFGNYGEWHTSPWGDNGAEPSYAKATDSTFKKIIDIGADVYGDYTLHIPVGVFDDNPWGEGTPFSAYYAMTRKTKYGVIGWRRDNIGDAGVDNFLIGNTFTYNGWKADTAILNRWKFAMITGEPLNGSTPCCPYFYHVRSEIGNYHYAGFGNGNYGNTSSATFDTLRNDFKISGYRYNFNGGSMPTVIYQNSSFSINLNIRNVNASPMYQKRWRLVYELRKANDSVIQKFTSKFNPYLFLPSSQDSIIKDTFILNPNAFISCTNKIVFYFEDTAGLLGKLPLTLSVPTRNSDGSYTLRSDVCVKEQSSLPLRDRIPYRNVNNRTEVKIFPNPLTEGTLTIALARQIVKPVMTEISDVSGRVLHRSFNIKDTYEIDVRRFPSGVYIVKVYNSLGIMVTLEKIIIN